MLRKEIIAVLETVKPFVPGTAVQNVFRQVVFMENVACAQDGVVGMLASCPTISKSDAIALDGVRLMEFLRCFQQDAVAIGVKNQRVQVSIDTATATFLISEVPSGIVPKGPKRFENVGDQFAAALRLGWDFADTSGKAGPLSCVCLMPSGIWSTDGACATRVRMKLPISASMVLPPRLKEVLGTLSVTGLSVDAHRLWLRGDGGVAWTSLQSFVFPDLAPVFQRATAAAKRVPAISCVDEGFRSALSAAVSAGGNFVRLVMGGDTVSFECDGQLAQVRVGVKSGSKLPNVTFSSAAGKLVGAVGAFSSMSVCRDEGLLYFTDAVMKADHVLMEWVEGSGVGEKESAAAN